MDCGWRTWCGASARVCQTLQDDRPGTNEKVGMLSITKFVKKLLYASFGFFEFDCSSMGTSGSGFIPVEFLCPELSERIQRFGLVTQ